MMNIKNGEHGFHKLTNTLKIVWVIKDRILEPDLTTDLAVDQSHVSHLNFPPSVHPHMQP